jgi:hypothetical protein
MARATGSGGYGIGVMRGFDCGTEDVAPGQAQAGATLNSDVATGQLAKSDGGDVAEVVAG